MLNPMENVGHKPSDILMPTQTIHCLHSIVPHGLHSVTLENIKNYFRKARCYMFAYSEGFEGGSGLEDQIKCYKEVYKSHRRPMIRE